ncbi:MAG: hypothetical protein HY810_06595 [Candidatus Omnitrophica bacterium]|nr:hypothetical protein [Candidatus Omnitrophota bacterium]
MRKIIGFLSIWVCLSAFNQQPLHAEMNQDLIEKLNEVFLLEIQSMQQCEDDSERFNLAMPYHQIILDKQNTINQLAELIDELDGVIEQKRLKSEIFMRDIQALNQGAFSQTIIIRRYNAILNKYGHPKVRHVITYTRMAALEHFMILTNMAQKLLEEQQFNR